MNETRDQTDRGPFSGRARKRQTSARVHFTNSAARVLITMGGIATIGAVALVCLFLVWVVVPLFIAPELRPDTTVNEPGSVEAETVLHVALDEYLTMAWVFEADGDLVTIRRDTGERLASFALFPEATPTSYAFGIDDSTAAFGFADGSIRFGHIRFATEFLEPEEVPDAARELEIGTAMPFREGMLERTPEDQYRLQTLEVELQEPIMLEEGAPITLIDISERSSGPIIAALSQSDTLHIRQISSRKNLLTNKVTVTLTGGDLSLDFSAAQTDPAWLKLSGLGDNIYLCWRDGRIARYDARSIASPRFAESIIAAPDPNIDLTAVAFLIGKTTLITGDSVGRVRAWFRINDEDALAPDSATLVLAHEMPQADAAVTSLETSARTRLVAAGYADGGVRLFHVTSANLLSEVEMASGVETVVLGPKDDALLGLSAEAMTMWLVDAPHPETSLSAILTPVWYEGYEEPVHVWQSSSGTDDFEPKYGLYPLIFGTIKATIYSMLFGVPLALLAAIYTSEMMHPRLRMRVKPAIELMASLPSVVLGFLAALVVAPYIQDVVPESLTCFATIPFAILLGSYFWQLLPRRFATRNARFRIVAITIMMIVGVWWGFLLGPLVERIFFAGDIGAWLDGQIGGGQGAWLFLLLPTSCLVVGYVSARTVTPWIRRRGGSLSEFHVACLDLGRFLALTAAAVGIAVVVSYVLANGPWSLDPRGTFVDTYVQRNALVVGFIMGFAIIPIIYTISEDALTAVPDHLRTASLGAGATPWQTAVRIIIPTAASGLFSAVMIGFGRAVGETMIVLMAAGNTPVMDWNIFNGFRTLSANIAVELPEAVKDSTHYRMLFLAALTLFIMTFTLNTVAETVRQRFRKRAFKI